MIEAPKNPPSDAGDPISRNNIKDAIAKATDAFRRRVMPIDHDKYAEGVVLRNVKTQRHVTDDDCVELIDEDAKN